MRINLNSINFGYNAQYHKLIQQRIKHSQSNDPAKNLLIKDDTSLLRCEDKITKLEKQRKFNHRFYEMTDEYIAQKAIHAKKIDAFFGDSSYLYDLVDQYESEIDNLSIQTHKPAILWREKLVNLLLGTLSSEKTADDSYNPIIDYTDEELEVIHALPNIGMHSKNVSKVSAAETKKALEANLTIFSPSASSPRGFCDVVGMEKIKEQLQDEIVDYAKNPHLAQKDYDEYGITPPRVFLFYGPPGCGKTYIARALALESDLTMYEMDVSKLGSRFVNQSANNIETAFKYLSDKGTKEKPILLFMDEVDSLAKERSIDSTQGLEDSKTLATLLRHIEDAKDKNIIIICATNKFDILDDAFVSRCDNQKYIGLPDVEQIKALVTKLLLRKKKGQTLAENKEEIGFLTNALLGHSNRSVKFIIDAASKIAKKDNRADISKEHVLQAITEANLQKIDEKTYKDMSASKALIGFI